jgi:hypothetical protein
MRARREFYAREKKWGNLGSNVIGRGSDEGIPQSAKVARHGQEYPKYEGKHAKHGFCSI